MILLTSLALAADSDLVLDLNVTGPLGDAIVDEEVTLPYSASIDKEYGKGEYRVDIEAIPVGRQVELTVKVIDTKPRNETTRVSLALEMPPETAQDASKTIMAPRGLKKDGVKVQYASFSVDASWKWGSGNWPEDARAGSVEPGSVVVVWEDTLLYTSSGEESQRARLRLAERTPGIGGYLPLTVVEDQGDWLKVSTGPVGDSCHTAGAFAPVDLALFVKREDLLLVTADTVSMDYSDGTHFELRPGVVVAPPSGKLVVAESELLMLADANDVIAEVTLLPGSLSNAYTPVALAEVAVQDDQVVASSNRSLGETRAGDVFWMGDGVAYLQGFWDAPVDPDAAPVETEEAAPEEEENYVGDASDKVDIGQARGIVHGTCGEYHFQMLPSRVKPASYVPNEGARVEAEVATEFVAAEWSLPAETELSWPDGSPAGSTIAKVDLAAAPTKTDNRKVKCGTVSLDTTGVPLVDGMTYEVDVDGTFDVCFDARAAKKN